MEHTIRKLGPTLKRLRLAKGLTADALARTVGITENAVRKLEAGDSKEPRFSTGLRIADALGLAPHALIDGSRRRSVEGPDLAAVVKEIRRHRRELEKEGVEHLAIFGSVARGEARRESDIDIMITPSKSGGLNLFKIVGVADMLSAALQRKADVVTEQSIKESRIRASVEEDAISVF